MSKVSILENIRTELESSTRTIVLILLRINCLDKSGTERLMMSLTRVVLPPGELQGMRQQLEHYDAFSEYALFCRCR